MLPIEVVARTYVPKFFAMIVLTAASPVVAVLGIAAFVGALLAVIGWLLVFVVGPWDLLVWLIKADWRTTHGEAPMAGLILGIIGLVLRGIAGALLEPALKLWHGCAKELAK